MIRLLLVDDHEIITDGIKSILEEEQNIHIVGQCSTAKEAYASLPATRPDVVITDIEMPEMSGIDLAKKIKANYPKISVLMLSMYDDGVRIQNSIKAGASGYILKNTGKKELLKAINLVYQGRNYFSGEVSQNVISSMLQGEAVDSNNPFSKLTQRELQICKLIVEEHTNPEIADLMFISEFTVKTHRRNIIKKLGVKSTVGLVKLALKHQLEAE